MEKHAICKGCRHYTNAPEGEWRCDQTTCKLHAKGVAEKISRENRKQEEKKCQNCKFGLAEGKGRGEKIECVIHHPSLIVSGCDRWKAKEEKPGAINELEMTNTALRKITEARNKILKWPCFKDLGKTSHDKEEAGIVCNEPTCELFGAGRTSACKRCTARQRGIFTDETRESADVKLGLADFGTQVDEEFKKIDKELKEGTKYDTGKPRIGEMIKDFGVPLLEVCKVWEFGTVKYSKSNWKKVDGGEDHYTNAMIRHFLAEDEEGIDAETEIEHYAHLAWNALSRIKFIMENKNKNKEEGLER